MSNKLPNYSQLPNTCGLSTFLMLLNPEKNLKVRKFLDDFYPKVKDFYAIDQSIKEYQWSYVLDYILLKSLGNNKLSEYLFEKIPDFETIKIYINFELKKSKDRKFGPYNEITNNIYENFFESGVVHPYIIRDHLLSLKLNIELKILFYLFGGEFIPQDSVDGTGSLFFEKKDLKNLNSNTNFLAKYHTIKQHKKRGDNFSVAINASHHWIALNSVFDEGNNYFLIVNDPSKSKPLTLKISTRRISDKVRFYFFRYNLIDAFILTEEVQKFLEKEIESDKKNILHFLMELENFLEKGPSLDEGEKEGRITDDINEFWEEDSEEFLDEEEIEQDVEEQEYVDTEEKLLQAQKLSELISSEQPFNTDGLDFSEDVLSRKDEFKNILKKTLDTDSEEEFVDKLKLFFKTRKYSKS